jgi:hypothetical protein
MKIKIYITTIVLSILTLSSCQEDNIIETGTVSSQDYLFAENIFNDVGRIVEDAFIDNGESKSCPSYSIFNSDTSDTDTIILDFGDGIPDDCLSYGKERRGKIIITYTGKYRDSLSVITTTFDHYYVNNNWIHGERIVTNNGRNTEGNVNFTIQVIEASITGNGTINWESTRNREWITGYNTFNNPYDDSYIISGNANGNSSNGQKFDITITKDLYVDLSCLIQNSCIITSGEVELIPNGFSKRIINYGDSICDCNYTVTLNGTDYFVVSN